jgi:hypothetical protein
MIRPSDIEIIAYYPSAQNPLCGSMHIRIIPKKIDIRDVRVIGRNKSVCFLMPGRNVKDAAGEVTHFSYIQFSDDRENRAFRIALKEAGREFMIRFMLEQHVNNGK